MSEKEHTSVADVMSCGVHTITGKATVTDAIKVMREHHVSSLVVERQGEHDEYGLLEVYDVAKEVMAENKSADRMNVYEIMQKPVLSVAADMDIRYAVRLLVRFRLTRALVIDDTRAPVGLVTMRDMVLKHMDG
ncbi:MAG: CBS domain-containing protein [Alphaproteobacteria bacterium]|nr:CBS domain-containing protein [Alphaproteobacteria bacterium]